MAQKKDGKTTGWIGYTLSWNDRYFKNQNFGIKYPFVYDRRHNISIVLIHNFSKQLSLSTEWIFMTGQALTFAATSYPELDNDGFNSITWTSPSQVDFHIAEYYQGKNPYRTPAYHRLDCSIRHAKSLKKGARTLAFGIYNVYNRQNPFFYFYKKVANYNQLSQLTLFPFLPSVSFVRDF